MSTRHRHIFPAIGFSVTLHPPSHSSPRRDDDDDDDDDDRAAKTSSTAGRLAGFRAQHDSIKLASGGGGASWAAPGQGGAGVAAR